MSNTYSQHLANKLQSFQFNDQSIPMYMHHGVVHYICDRLSPGDFLYAVFSNNLSKACYHADGTNINLIPVYCAFLYNYVPSECWGSEEKVKNWLTQEVDTQEVDDE